jgi:hypothetical protein
MLKKIRRELKALWPYTRTVDFVICGTQKGGTTALDAYLREHPEVCMADRKEVNFFDKDRYFTDKRPNYSKYQAYFSPKRTHKVLGEATPIYMYWKDAPKRIFEYNSKMKIVLILRNPIERAYSHWNMERSRNRENLSFKDAINIEQKRSREALPYQLRTFSYIERGCYLEQIRRMWEFFPKENVYIIRSEDLKYNPEVCLNNLADFLGISYFRNVKSKNVHSRPYVCRMGKEEKIYLLSIFEPEIKALEKELKWDCSNWRT